MGNFTTIPQYFKEYGYHTVSVGKVFHPGSTSGHEDDYPFSWTEKPYHPSSLRFENAKVCPTADGTLEDNLLCAVNVSTQPENTLPDIQSTEYATAFLRRWAAAHAEPGEERFFLALGYHKPHIPFRIPQQYLDLYPLSSMSLAPDPTLPPTLPPVAWNPWTDLRKRHDVSVLNVSFPYGPLPADFQKRTRQHYYAAVTYADSQVGTLLEVLERTGLRNDTLIVLMGDHGWSLGEHQEWAKYSNYQVATRTPLIISLPPTLFPHGQDLQNDIQIVPLTGVRRGPTYVHDPVMLLDLFPTLAAASGLPVPQPCQSRFLTANETTCTEGLDILPVLGSVSSQRMDILTQYPRPSVQPQWDSDQPKLADISIMGYSMLSTAYRYSEWVKFNTTSFKPDWGVCFAKELYDLSIDPREDRNAADKVAYVSVVEWLSRRLSEIVNK